MLVRGEVVTPDEISVAEADRWAKTAAASPVLRNPFFSLAFARAVRESGRDVRICRLFQDGDDQPVAWFPFQYADGWHRLMRAGEMLGGHMSDYCGLIAPAGVVTAPRKLLKMAGLSGFQFSHLDDSQVSHGLSGEKPDIGLIVDLSEGGNKRWQDCCAANKGLEADTRRCVKRAEKELGPLRFTLHTTDIATEVDRVIRIKREQYVRTAVNDALQPEWTQRLLHLLAVSQEPDCQGVVSTLFAGEHWLASHVGIRSRSVLHYWFPVYSVEYKNLSPGRLMLKGLMEASDSAGYDSIDNGAGDSPAKRQVSNREHGYSSGWWGRANPLGAAHFLSISAQWRLEALKRKAG